MSDSTPYIDDYSNHPRSRSYWASEAGKLAADNAFLKHCIAELEATIEKVEALIPDWREYALDGTLGSSAVDCADDLEVALGDKV